MNMIFIIIISLLFLSLPVGLTIAGFKSIIEKKSIMPGPVFMRGNVTGNQAVVAGILYLFIAGGIFSMYGSFHHYVFCDDRVAVTCNISKILKVPFDTLSQYSKK